MLELAHAVPGRLRVRVLPLRGRAAIADEVRSAVLTVRGVRAATANAVTGSVIISYDPQLIRLAELWDELRNCIAPIGSAFDTACNVPARAAQPTTGSRIDALADAALAAVLEKLFGRSAVALVRAVI